MFRLIFLVSLIQVMAACGGKEEEQLSEDKSKLQSGSGVIGSECKANPVVFNERRQNVCSGTGTVFYPGVLAAYGKKNIVKHCKRNNALDYGCKYGNCCSSQCSRVAYCLWPVSR